jgi:hypothetical protein
MDLKKKISLKTRNKVDYANGLKNGAPTSFLLLRILPPRLRICGLYPNGSKRKKINAELTRGTDSMRLTICI